MYLANKNVKILCHNKDLVVRDGRCESARGRERYYAYQPSYCQRVQGEPTWFQTMSM